MDYRALALEIMQAMAFKKAPLDEPRQISRGEMGILMYLYHREDEIAAGDLSKGLGLSTGRTAIALKGLENKQYIKRLPDPADKRRVRVCLQEAGRQFVLMEEEKVLHKTETMLAYLGEEDAKELVRIIKRLMEKKDAGH